MDESRSFKGKIHRPSSRSKDGEFRSHGFRTRRVIFMTTTFNPRDNLGAILRLHPDVRVKIWLWKREYGGDARQSPGVRPRRGGQSVFGRRTSGFGFAALHRGEGPAARRAGRLLNRPSHQLEFECLPTNDSWRGTRPG